MNTLVSIPYKRVTNIGGISMIPVTFSFQSPISGSQTSLDSYSSFCSGRVSIPYKRVTNLEWADFKEVVGRCFNPL